MTKAVYQSMFVSLSALLMAALFVLQPTENPEMREFQLQVRTSMAQAATELLAGESFAEPFALVWVSIDDFYSESADQAIALLNDDVLANVALLFNSDYLVDQAIASAPLIARAPQEKALANIVPMSEAEPPFDPYFNDSLVYSEEAGGVVAGESIVVQKKTAPPVVWMTISDSITEFPYCVAVFNGTVNSYPGACAVDSNNTSNQVYEN